MKRKMIYTGVAIGAIGCCAMLGVGIHSALGTNVAAQTDRDDAIEITATQTATVPTATGTEVRRPRSRNSKWRGLADPAWPIRQQSRSQYLAATFANRSPITVIYYHRAVA